MGQGQHLILGCMEGSGTWTFDCQDVVIEKNILMNATGSLDSCGVHIDYDNANVVVQYNFSYNNEGGFVQILGGNINSGYRYNISVADGSRINGVNGADQNGRIFNVSDYCGVNSPAKVLVHLFIIILFMCPQLLGQKLFSNGSGETKFYNNLVYVEPGGNPIFTSLASQGVQYDISHNLFYPYSAFSLANGLTDNALFLNPKLRNPGSSSASMYKLLSGSNAKYAALLSIPRLTHLITATIMVGLITLAMLFLILLLRT